MDLDLCHPFVKGISPAFLFKRITTCQNVFWDAFDVYILKCFFFLNFASLNVFLA